MAKTVELFINPQAVRALAGQFQTLSTRMINTLTSVSNEIQNTETTYQAQSATDMRDKFNEVKAKLDQFYVYLERVATYLIQNVADPADVVDQVASSNVASIKKPQ